jgi:hypothetical protein
MVNRNDGGYADAVAGTIRYVDGLFGPGAGERHVAFLDRIQNDALREAVHRCHAVEADTEHVSVEENYLLGMCVLAATRSYAAAAMFAKVLMHLGTPSAKILEAIGRLGMWVGPLPAAEAALVVQKAIAEYEREGFASLSVWFPPVESINQEAPTMPPRSSPPHGLERVTAQGVK